MILNFISVLMFTTFKEVASIDTEDLDLFSLPDYLDMNSRAPKPSYNIRDNFLRKKTQKTILRNFDKLIPNNTIHVDGILHLEVTLDWKKAQEMETDFKNLLIMKNIKYVYQRDAHWRTWRQIEDEQGKKKIICYKCQSKIYPNCTDCSNRGIWVIEEEIPPCPYELFALINSNELCASNYTQLGEELQSCPSIIKYADLTKSCNNPILTRWRFTEDYKISERTWTSVICRGREYCEILTLYQIRPEYVVFRIINATSSDIIYSRIMRINRKNFACVNDCGIIDLKTFTITKNKEKSTILNLFPNKSKRNSVKKNKKILEKKNIHRKILPDITDNYLVMRKKKTKIRKINNIGVTNVSAYTWVNTGHGIYISIIETTTKSHCKKMMESDATKDEENNYSDNNNDLEDK